VVYKEDTVDATYTRIRKLQSEERITEIARMLSGEELSEEALSNARVLLRI
jgi:DNA repair protein RecN (Recombination protein N)